MRRSKQPLARPRALSLCALLTIAACLNPRPEEVPGIDELPTGAEPGNSSGVPPSGAGQGAAGGAGAGGLSPESPADGNAGSSGSGEGPPFGEPPDAGVIPPDAADGGEPDGGL